MNDKHAQKSVSNALLAQLGLKLGDYCHAYGWSDKDPQDPFAVGFLERVLINRTGIYFALGGDGVPARYWRRIKKITLKEGKSLLAR